MNIYILLIVLMRLFIDQKFLILIDRLSLNINISEILEILN